MGVKYVIVHKDVYINTDLIEQIEDVNRVSKNEGLKFVKSFSPQKCPSDIMCTQKSGQIDVYEVVAKAEKMRVKSR